jgi:hypothetical protein
VSILIVGGNFGTSATCRDGLPIFHRIKEG